MTERWHVPPGQLVDYLDDHELSGVAVTTAGAVFATSDLELSRHDVLPEGSRR